MRIYIWLLIVALVLFVSVYSRESDEDSLMGEQHLEPSGSIRAKRDPHVKAVGGRIGAGNDRKRRHVKVVGGGVGAGNGRKRRDVKAVGGGIGAGNGRKRRDVKAVGGRIGAGNS